MRRDGRRRALVVVALVSCLWAGDGWAQTDDESNGAVQFNLSTPGARSLGMGGAYLGSVDDATAAYANPAGLLQLSEPEVSLEARRWSYSTPYADRGRTSGMPSGIGADTISGVELGVAEAELESISFASMVFPRPDWALALYHHQVASFEAELETGGIFAGVGSGTSRLFPVRSAYALDVSQTGLALAYRWGTVAAGIGVSVYDLQLESSTQRFAPDGFFDPPDFSSDAPVNFQTQTGDAKEVGYAVGLRWDLSPAASLGMVYRSAPEMEIEVLSSSLAPTVPIPPRQVFTRETVLFDLPDSAGIGISFRPSPALTFNVDVHRVYYSDLVGEDFFVFFEEVQDQRVRPEDFVVDDATEVHVGAEYVFVNRILPLAVRVGGWYDPDHRLRAEAGPMLNQARLFAGEDQIHATAGLGLVITSRFQIDAAVDVSDEADTVSVSAAYRF